MTAADIRNRDAAREAQIINECDLEVVWECEIASLRKVDSTLDAQLKANHAPVRCPSLNMWMANHYQFACRAL